MDSASELSCASPTVPIDASIPATRRRLSSDAVHHRLAKHVGTAPKNCPGLTGKTITPHVLRHSSAMRLLHAGNDIAVIALWLSHQNLTPDLGQIEPEQVRQRIDRQHLALGIGVYLGGHDLGLLIQ